MNIRSPGMGRIVSPTRRVARKIAMYLTASAALHVGACALIAGAQRVASSITTSSSPGKTMEDTLEAMNNPEIVKNEMTPQDRERFHQELERYAKDGEKHIEQFKKTGSSDLDYGDFFVSFEYYAQHLAEKSYLMPKESREELLAIYWSDLQAFGRIVRSGLSRDEKFEELVKIVYSRSVSDPDANAITSLLVPEGGQNCFTRERYMLALLSPFAREVLYPGERLVSARYNGHVELGVYEENFKTLSLVTGPRINAKEWTADLYDPHVEVQLDIDIVLKGGLKSKKSYEPFLVARANTKGMIAKVRPIDEKNPLPLNQGGISSPYSYRGGNLIFDHQPPSPPAAATGKGSSIRTMPQPPAPGKRELVRVGATITKRQLPSPKLLERRKERIMRQSALRRPSGPIEFDVVPIEEWRWHMDNGKKALGMADYARADKEFTKALGSDYESLKAFVRANLPSERSDWEIKRKTQSSLFARSSDGRDLTEIEDGRIKVLNFGFSGMRLNYTRDIKNISSLAGLKDLEKLDIYSIEVEDISPFAGLTRLKTLKMENARVKDLSPLGELKQLEILVIGSDAVEDISPLAGLTRLEGLNVSCKKIRDISPLAGLTQLEWLWLNNTGVSDISPLAGLEQLEMISMYNTKVSDLSPLARLTKLEWIGLPVTISEEEVNRFRASHPNTKIYLR